MDHRSRDKSAFGQPQGALPVPDTTVPGNLDQEPESGEQYMLRVRMEAESIPNIAVAPNRSQLLQPKKLVKDTADTEPGYKDASVLPSSAWLDRFANFFSDQKRRFQDILQRTDVPANFALPNNGQQKEWKSFCYSPSSNMLYALSSIDQVMALRLLKWMDRSWLAGTQLRHTEGLWIWYLVLKLDDLLDYDDMHILRELCRKLKTVRDSIGIDNIVGRWDEIAALNILIASVTRGYRQRDLED